MVSKTLTSVAIIGGGPGGLAAAIALSKLPHLLVTLYEQKPEPREAGAGISLSANAWRVLDLLGAADGVKGGSKSNTQLRNGYTGKVLHVMEKPESSDADKRGAVRARRTRLQSGLLAKIPPGVIQYGKKLASLEDLGDAGVRLIFQDQTEAVADLVVGADGIHSTVRRTLFPNHHLRFTGMIAWRTLVPASSLAHISDVTDATAWWWGEHGHAYFSPVDDIEEGLDDPFYEITLRLYHEPEIPGRTVVWGVPVSNEKVKSHFENFDQRVKDAIEVVPEGQWREFSGFSGPLLESVTGWDKVVLIGDASHPLSGAFGSGATFAMDDGWILAQALEHTKSSSINAVKGAVQIFEQVRSPYYKYMYKFLEGAMGNTPSESLSFDEKLNIKVNSFVGHSKKDFIFKNDIEKVWNNYLKGKKQLYLLD